MQVALNLGTININDQDIELEKWIYKRQIFTISLRIY